MQNYNFHTHSIFSDGKSQPREIVEEAIRQGFSAIGFSEHSPLPFDNTFSVKDYDMPKYVAEIRMETHDLNVGDEIMIIGPTTGVYEDTIEEIRVDLKPVQQTVKGEACSLPVKSLVRRGDKVYKMVMNNAEL